MLCPGFSLYSGLNCSIVASTLFHACKSCLDIDCGLPTGEGLADPDFASSLSGFQRCCALDRVYKKFD